jgi:disulfide bond formation protein DsbB
MNNPSRAATSLPPQPWTLLLLAWLATMASTLGALFFSEVMGMEPCVLCWYQRIAMFPLVIVLAIGVYRQDIDSAIYAFPLAVAGWLAAGYHWLLYSGFVPKDLQPCGRGPSCAEVDLRLAGFLTIPLVSLLAFSLVIILLAAAWKGRGPAHR